MNNFTILNKTVALLAKRNSGKSVLLKHLVESEKHKFSKIFVICPTEKINRFYSDIVCEECIFDSYDEKWVDKLISKMTEINSNKSNKERKNILLILDDVVSDHNFHQSPTLKKLFIRGRHINIAIIITFQYLNLIPPVARNNMDFIFCGQMNKQSVDLLMSEFISGDIEKNEFIKMYNRCTRDYNFLVINNNSVKDDDLNSIYGCIKTPNIK
jgi:hypothetical protein